MTLRSVIRPQIDRLAAFQGVPTADTVDPGLMALMHLNECPHPPSPRVVEAIAAMASGLNRYGEARPAALGRRLSSLTGVPAERIVIGNGSDEILALISTMTLGPGDNAVMPTPSFPRYRLAAAIQGAEARLVRIAPDGRNDVAALLAAIDGDTRVVYACTPNNPSGAPLDEDEMLALALGVPEHVLLVVDEAYAEFHAFEGGADALPALARRKGPWISTRTLSKAYALAGLRVGYALASSAAIAEGLVKVKLNFNLNRLAAHAAIAALDDREHAQRCIGAVVAERERMRTGLSALGLTALPSRANFLSFDIGRPAGPVMEAMARRSVLAREWRDPGFDSYIRISIGLPHDNDAALDALAAALSEA
jgi:histidinol-phosphate aminotransferase